MLGLLVAKIKVILKAIVHCHSIHLTLFQHPGFFNSSGTSDFVRILSIFLRFFPISCVFY